MDTTEYSEEYLKTQGNLSYHKRDYAKAIAYYSSGIQRFPTYPVFYLNRSLVYLSQHMYQASLTDSQAAKSLDPKNPKVFYRIAVALQASGEYTKAIDTLSEFFSLGIENTEISELYKDLQAKVSGFLMESQHPERRKFEDLVNWLVNGGAIFPKVYLEYYSYEYRGVHCSRQINKDECVLFVPLSHIITLELAQAAPVGRRMKERNLDLLSPKHCYLATFVLQEERNPNSFWRPYLNILPKSFQNFPIFFSESERECLAGSPFLDQVNEKISDIQEDYDSICSIDETFSQFTLEEFSKTRMAVCSRIFSITINGKVTDAFVPLADMLNHRRPRQTNWSYSNSRKGFIVEAIEDIPKHDQIMDSYGQKCNSRFFLNYGFIVENNDCNEFPFTARLSLSHPHYTLKGTHLRERTMIYRLRAEIIDQKFLEFLSCLRFLEEDDVVKINSFITQETAAGTEVKAKNFLPSSIETEKKVIKTFISLTEKALANYPSSLETDLKTLQDSLQENEKNCLKMIIGEKSILHYYLQSLNDFSNCLETLNTDLNSSDLSTDCKYFIKNVIIPIHT